MITKILKRGRQEVPSQKRGEAVTEAEDGMMHLEDGRRDLRQACRPPPDEEMDPLLRLPERAQLFPHLDFSL